MVGSADPEVSDLVGVVGYPSGADLLEPGVDPMSVSALDHPRANRQTQCERPQVVQTVESIVQIAVVVVRFEAERQAMAMNDALDKLAAEDKVKAELVKLCYFAGLTIEEAAQVLGISAPTAKRYWTFARPGSTRR